MDRSALTAKCIQMLGLAAIRRNGRLLHLKMSAAEMGAGDKFVHPARKDLSAGDTAPAAILSVWGCHESKGVRVSGYALGRSEHDEDERTRSLPTIIPDGPRISGCHGVLERAPCEAHSPGMGLILGS